MKLGEFWIVLYPTTESTLADICFKVDVQGLILQVRGGLVPERIAEAYPDELGAMTAAKALMGRERRLAGSKAEATEARVKELLWDAITEPRLRDRASALLKEMMAET